MSLRTAVDPAAIPPAVHQIVASLAAAGHGAWVVGGCVRDHLMDRPVADWDLCTTAEPKELMRIFPRAIPTGIDHGTITVVIDKHHYEVTTLRGETSYSDGRRPDAVFFVQDVTHDLARRDFTVNAIAYDVQRGVLLDPFDGMGDLRTGVIRAVGDPMARFGEDGLRVLRAARFVATLEFALDRATHDAITANLDTFRKVSAERVRDEWIKTMKARRPSRAFTVMLETGILGVVCPPLTELVGCAQGPEHAHDVWTHTLATLDAVPPGDAELRVAALLHEIAKPRTRGVDEATGAPAFPGHEERGAEMAEEFLKRYRFSNEERARITHLIRHHTLDGYDPAWTDKQVRQLVKRVGRDQLPALFTLARACATARDASGSGAHPRLDAHEARIAAVLEAGSVLSTRELAVNGMDLQKELGIPPSRKLGQILDALLDRVLENPGLNTRNELLTIARTLA